MGKMHRIIFWQNIISPHQIDFLREVSKIYDVTLVIDEAQDTYRKNDGWGIPDFSFVRMHVKPNAQVLNQLFQNKEDVHVFSGIDSYPIVQTGFKLAIKKNVRIGLMSEPMDWAGIKGKLRFLKGVIQQIKYNSKIDFILAIGIKGRWWFQKIRYSSEIIYDFGYFIDVGNELLLKESNVVDKKIIYVGRINDNKGVFDLVEAAIPIIDEFEVMEIYGRGEKLATLNKELSKPVYKGKVIYGGLVPNEKILKKINDSKLLVIPSKGKDGWGVVVNEALLLGVPVIASSNVGSSYLLDGVNSGAIVEPNNIASLSSNISKWLLKEINKKELSNLMHHRISPKIAAHYFKEILDFTFHSSKNRPTAPWLK